jgi:hypothetical protein
MLCLVIGFVLPNILSLLFHCIVGFIPPLLVPHKILDIPSLSHIEVTNPHQIPIVLPQKIPQNVERCPKKIPEVLHCDCGRSHPSDLFMFQVPHMVSTHKMGVSLKVSYNGTPNGWFIIYGTPMTVK